MFKQRIYIIYESGAQRFANIGSANKFFTTKIDQLTNFIRANIDDNTELQMDPKPMVRATSSYGLFDIRIIVKFLFENQ